MINIKYTEKYCCEDISLIENYDKAISSDETYDCHHRNEIALGVSANRLIKMGLYWNRPASELVFLTHGEHTTLHNTNIREETHKKMSEANKGDKNPFYDKHHTEEARKKISEGVKGSKWMNNGQNQKYVKPDEINLYLDKGYYFGRLTK